MSSAPTFASTPRCAAVSFATANTNRDGTGTIDTLFTAGASGSRVEHLEICAAGTTTAGVVRIFLHDGSTYYLFKEVLVSAITPSTSVEVFRSSLSFASPSSCIVLPSGWSIRVSTHNAETFKAFAFGGDF